MSSLWLRSIDSSELSRLALVQLAQVTLLALVLGTVALVVSRRRPHLAYLLWMLILVKCLTPPLWSSSLGAFGWLQADSRESVSSKVAAPAPMPPAVAPDLTLTLQNLPALESEAAAPAMTTATSRSFPLASALLLLWLVGGLAAALVAVARAIRFRRQLRQSSVPATEELERLTSELSQRLGMRREVCLCISQAAIGPAALGVWRPTIILPEALTSHLTLAELEPIVAHELLHHRRGDTLAAWLQLAAQIVWWFHPLVWWANRGATRDRERACDEEVIAGLACDPLQYARGLVGVLELKRSLQPLFAPSMRPADISKQRLDRILDHSASFVRRTPAWCWLLTLLLALVALPGAAREPQPEKSPPKNEQPATLNLLVEPANDKQTAAPAAQRADTHPITVRGRAVDHKGQPIAGATVYLVSTNGREGRLATAKSDAEGRYEMRDAKLPLMYPTDGEPRYGCFEVVATAPGQGFAWSPLTFYYPDRKEPEIVDGKIVLSLHVGTPPVHGDDPIDVRLEFPMESSITGRVLDAAGQPIAGAEVSLSHCTRLPPPAVDGVVEYRDDRFWAVDGLPNAVRITKTAADGSFALSGVGEGLVLGINVDHPLYGNYYYRVATSDDAQAVDPEMGQQLILRKVEARLERSRPVRLQIAQPHPTRQPPTSTAFAARGQQPSIVSGGKTDDRGQIEMNLPPGEYELSVDPPETNPPFPFVRNKTTLVVKPLTAEELARNMPGDVQTETAGLGPGTQLDFQVVDADTGQGIPGVHIDEEFTPDLKRLNWVMTPRNQPTDAEGKLRTVTVPGKRRYYVSENLPPHGYTIVEQPAEPLELKPHEQVSVRIVLRKKPAVAPVEGTLQGKSNLDLRTGTVEASLDLQPPNQGQLNLDIQAQPDQGELKLDLQPEQNQGQLNLLQPAADEPPKPDLDAAALEGPARHREAVLAIRELGGSVVAIPSASGSKAIQVILSQQWRGGPEGLKWLEQLDRLARLQINDVFGIVIASADAAVPGRLEITGAAELRVTDEWLAPLAKLTTLRALEVPNNCNVSDAGLAHLAGLTQLESVMLGGAGVTDAGLAHLTPLIHLKHLHLHDVRVSDAGLAALAGASDLERLSILSPRLTGEGFAALAGLRRLGDLSLQDCPITDAGLKQIARFPLARLLLDRAQITDAGMAALADQNGLRMLMIQHAQNEDFTGRSLAHLRTHSQLRDLRIGTKSITAADLANLSQLKQLSLLMIDAPVDDAGLAEIGKLSSLQYFYLGGARISDAGLASLHTLQRLKMLLIPEDGLSAETIQKLRAALPQTDVKVAPANTIRL